jgi:hypothetical protein
VLNARRQKTTDRLWSWIDFFQTGAVSSKAQSADQLTSKMQTLAIMTAAKGLKTRH